MGVKHTLVNTKQVASQETGFSQIMPHRTSVLVTGGHASTTIATLPNPRHRERILEISISLPQNSAATVPSKTGLATRRAKDLSSNKEDSRQSDSPSQPAPLIATSNLSVLPNAVARSSPMEGALVLGRSGRAVQPAKKTRLLLEN